MSGRKPLPTVEALIEYLVEQEGEDDEILAKAQRFPLTYTNGKLKRLIREARAAKPKADPELRDRILSLHRSGLGEKTIADRLHMSEATLYRRRKALGIVPWPETDGLNRG